MSAGSCSPTHTASAASAFDPSGGAQPAPAGAARALLAKPLVYVTGKGGAGKTAVAAALGIAAASSGRRTVVCELAGAHQLADTFRPPADARGEVPLRDNLWALSIDPQDALREWLRDQPGGALAVAVLTRSRAFAHFVAAAPGAKELVTIGKIIDLSQRSSDADAPEPYDLVIADAPSTGHALAMLAAPRGVAELAPVGPIGRQARELRDFLADPDSTGYVGVSLPEEMSLQEVLELEHGVRDALGRDLDLIVVNGIYPDRFSDDEDEQLQALAQRVPRGETLRAVLAQHRRARVHAARVEWLREQTPTPIVTLPFMFQSEIGQREYTQFGRELCHPS
jgi:anion-transporting  ArsA/GET3 family ATPase